MPALLIATTNAGKLREIRGLLAGLPFEFRSLADVAPVDEPIEDGATFAANARLKAHHYARATGLMTVAEDSGLEIDALDGAPGVFSARVPGRSYPDKFDYLFRLMDARGAHVSGARFVCTLALVHDEQVLFEARGTIEGALTREPRGTGGFGYDPILLVPTLSRTIAELTEEEKAAISHRGQAFRSLRTYLEAGSGTLH